MRVEQKRTFETYQPKLITPNSITSPCVFNGMCLIRRFKVTVEEIDEPVEVLAERLIDLWNRRDELKLGHSSNRSAMVNEAKRLGIELK